MPFLQIDMYNHSADPYDHNRWLRSQVYLLFRREPESVKAALISALVHAFQAELICGLTVEGELPNLKINLNKSEGNKDGNKTTH